MAKKLEFIEFLIDSSVLKFGSFVTKSGRKTPYFINSGNFDTSKKLKILGGFYAELINSLGFKFDALFGPAYKGIPLVVSCCLSLLENFGVSLPFFFDRKEEKDHGEGGSFVGYLPKFGDKVAIIEDVLTAGTEVTKMVPKLKSKFKIEVSHLFITVNRCERVQGSSSSAVASLKKNFEIEVHSIIDIFDIRNFIKNKSVFEPYLTEMDNYIEKYCVC